MELAARAEGMDHPFAAVVKQVIKEHKEEQGIDG
jgi:hypothetical protein